MPPASSCCSPSPSSSSSPICHSSPVPDRGKKPRREAGRQRPRSTRSSHSRQGRGGRPLRPSSVCFLSGRRRHKMAVVLCSCPRSCSSLSAAGGLYLIGFYLLCSLFENLRCSPPNLPPQKKEEESKFLKFMRNPLSTC